MAWILGLTGGIGAGKSTAADWFRREGFPVVDADALSRSLTAPEGGAIEAIRSAFGSSFITPEGAIDRAKMRELVFEHPAERERLEAVLRPRIRSECLAALERACRAADAAGKAFAVFDCPLLCEWPEAAAAAERILVIDLAQDEQIRRVCLRSGLSPERVRSIISAQLPRAKRLAKADYIIYNGGTRAAFEAALSRLAASLSAN